jgi:hypothetical protein
MKLPWYLKTEGCKVVGKELVVTIRITKAGMVFLFCKQVARMLRCLKK